MPPRLSLDADTTVSALKWYKPAMAHDDWKRVRANHYFSLLLSNLCVPFMGLNCT